MTYADSMEEIDIAVRSLSPYVWVRTHEEQRFIEDFSKRMKANNRDVNVWSIYQGIVSPEIALTGERAAGTMEGTWDPAKAMEKIVNTPQSSESRGTVIIMRDPMLILQGPIIRQLRDCYVRLRERRVTIVFLSPQLGHGPGGKNQGLPPTMEKQVVVVDFHLPTLKEIGKLIRQTVRQAAKVNNPRADMPKDQQDRLKKQLDMLKFNNDEYHNFSRALQGLTHSEVDVAVSSCLHHLKTLNLDFLVRAKKQIISRSDILEYHDTTKKMEDIGGMDLAKEFFDDYKFAHTSEAKQFGVEPLKGILLLGIPGCGKSQLSKAVASAWGLPLLRMDVGRVMTGLVGGSESRMRDAIQQVEAVAPCVLWIDEVEKALSGTKSSNFSDGGTMARVFGTLLTAMEEGLEGVTILATANDISMLPPEFIRRFDETFFVDLPGPEERKEIFNIHLRLKKFGETELDLDKLVSESVDYTGHELEKAIKRAIAFAFKDKDRKLKTEHISNALTETKPLSFTMGEKLSKLREKAVDRFRYASSWAQGQSGKYRAKKEKMDMDNLELPEMRADTKTEAANANGLQLD